MALKTLFALALLSLAFPFISNAAVVNPSETAVFKFDLTEVSPANLVSASYDCGKACGDDFGMKLFYSSTIDIHYGTRSGANDLGQARVKNPYGYDITNITWAGLLPDFAQDTPTTVFATFRFVDDVYNVDTFALNLANGASVAGTAVSPVPLPAGFTLLLAGLTSLCFFSNRHRQKN